MVVFMFAPLLCAGLASTAGHQGYVCESKSTRIRINLIVYVGVFSLHVLPYSET